ncbi:MAG TPA: NAD(P)/FAD-dependent oxidoreductase, partial [Acidimicrobiales bacterium]|nr:NAD(P)/FAD-dependent oxidoreductase [Acidimicrobiales bacterium]
MPDLDAVVVGSGPNGLAAAITLARAGMSVEVLEARDTPGGGLRTKELTLPGYRHDVCSAIHPMGPATPFLRRGDFDIDWVLPDVQVAHPLDDGSAVTLHHSLSAMSPRWRRFFKGLVWRWDEVADSLLGPILRVPSHPLTLLRFGLRLLPPATALARSFGDREGALFTGIAAHANTNLSWPLSPTGGVTMIAAGHVVGWPLARGGSQSIADALVARLESLGGRVTCGVEVRSRADLPVARAHVFDTTPWQLSSIVGRDNVPRAWRRFRRGGGSFKLDYALDGPMPWTS